MVKTFGKTGNFMFLVFALCAARNLKAQDEGVRIYRVEGTDFALTRTSGRTVFPVDAVNSGGLALERSGIVHTGPGTLLELQLIPSGTVIKLSENTSLVYNGVDAAGKFTDLGLLYGRIRVVTNSTGEENLVIRGGGVSARMGAGDLGVDYVLEPGTGSAALRPLFRVYTFRGGAELFPYANEELPAYFGETESLSAAEGECLSVDISSGYTFAKKETLGKEITAYWAENNFTGTPPLPMPDTKLSVVSEEPAVPAAAPPPVYVIPPESVSPLPVDAGQRPPARVRYFTKNLVLGIGLTLTLASIAAQAVSYSQFDTPRSETARTVFTISYTPLGIGLLTLLGGILYNPQPAAR